MGADDVGALRFLVDKVVHLGNGPVEGDHGEAMVVHVKNQVLPHDREANQCDVRFCIHKFILSEGTILKATVSASRFFIRFLHQPWKFKKTNGPRKQEAVQEWLPNWRRGSVSSIVFRLGQFAWFISWKA